MMASAHLQTKSVALPRRALAGTPLRQQHIAARRVPCQLRRSGIAFADATLQFIRGINEPTIPDVQLTRSKEGSSGTATFVFQEPTVFEASNDLGDITGLYMVDAEGELSTVDVSAKFVNGKPDRIEARYVMRTAFEWDRFMRFMERYAEEKGLGFSKSK